MRRFPSAFALGLLIVAIVPASAALAQPAPSAPSASSPAAAPPAASSPLPAEVPERSVAGLPRGVAVTAADDASTDAAWALAATVYADEQLRPRALDEPTARVLAGDPPGPTAPARHLELSALRRSFAPSSTTAAPLLLALSRELGVSGVIVVWTDPSGQTNARLLVASPPGFVAHDLRPSVGANLRLDWSDTTAWLHTLARAGSPPSRLPPPSKPSQPPPQQGSFLGSGWFWGAVVMAAGAGVLLYSLSSNNEPSSTVHVQGRVQQ